MARQVEVRENAYCMNMYVYSMCGSASVENWDDFGRYGSVRVSDYAMMPQKLKKPKHIGSFVQ